MKKIWTFALVIATGFVLSACTLTITGETEPVTVAPRPAPTTPAPTPAPRPTPTPSPVVVVPSFPLQQVLQYQCTDARLLVEYTSNDSARVNFNGWNNLTRSIMHDGWFTYKNDDYTWYAHGKDGYLMRGNEIVRRNCTY